MLRLLAVAVDVLAAALFLVPLLLLLTRAQDPSRRLLSALLSLYAAAVFSVVGLPSLLSHTLDFSFNWLPLLDGFSAPLSFLKNELLNTVLFIPIGFIAFLIWPAFRTPQRAALLGLCLSAFIEVSQFFTFRLTDVDDLITNTAGAAIGCLLARRLCRRGKVPESSAAACGAGTCVSLLALTAAVMMTLQPFAAHFLWQLVL